MSPLAPGCGDSVNAPSPTPALKRKCLLVVTRAFPSNPANGRQRIFNKIREALRSDANIDEFRLQCFIESKNPRKLIAAAMHWLLALFKRKPLPLQVALFFDSVQCRSLLAHIAHWQPQTVYFDGIRCTEYLRTVRKAFPDLVLVCDLDDLMSRRMDFVQRSSGGISLGYLTTSTPLWLRKLLKSTGVARRIAQYESKALSLAELEALQYADHCTLVSLREAEILQQRSPPGSRAAISAIPPPFEPLRRIERPPTPPIRFVFIGSDALVQNHLTIQWLAAAWNELKPKSSCHIYGDVSYPYTSTANLYFEGFAAKLSDVYTANSILLTPSFLNGGVKTKVLEAIAYGVLVAGNEATFEGIDLPSSEMKLSPEDLRSLIQEPDDFLPPLTAAARKAQSHFSQQYNSRQFKKQWLRAMQISTP